MAQAIPRTAIPKAHMSDYNDYFSPARHMAEEQARMAQAQFSRDNPVVEVFNEL